MRFSNAKSRNHFTTIDVSNTRDNDFKLSLINDDEKTTESHLNETIEELQ